MPGSHLTEMPEKKVLNMEGKTQYTLGLTAMVVVTLGMRTHQHTSIPVKSGDARQLTSQQLSEGLST
jgi:hypothetical protein